MDCKFLSNGAMINFEYRLYLFFVHFELQKLHY